ncbi:imidazole glycerol phosphate synthase subunit HisH [Methylobacterium sp. J-067]|uniref:imidazole glycerol phosphate synthase subunit HisH n=1 Tax=Methylobacterium sp. J-067 TaxID=2836648 RepID=UPI001FBA2268|nr:imidazole glycerol phosphate synthase subunit HisH [Methylobacterium sp. J-067]MCJ2027062.1 imidazole glycerol phosphate synthase subunit HisH [Methylobacterium sp. J-067]
MTGRTVAIIDYGSGNLHSALKAFERAAREAGLDDTRIVLTADPEVVVAADRIVLPGVGAYADCRAGLDAVPGMVEAMTGAVKEKGTPFLGICVGMQLLASRGLEYAQTPGLGWIPGDVGPIRPSDPALKVPHMGWNTLRAARPHALFEGIPTGEHGLHAYFVHSFALTPERPADTVMLADYGGPVTAAVARENVAGMQFHPEKSQQLGLALIANFLRWRP